MSKSPLRNDEFLEFAMKTELFIYRLEQMKQKTGFFAQKAILRETISRLELELGRMNDIRLAQEQLSQAGEQMSLL